FAALAQPNYFFKCQLAKSCSLGHPNQEKPNPMFDIVCGSYGGQCVIISAPIPGKEIREIESRLRQNVFVHQVKRYQQSPDTPIAVEKRVNGFKLIVTQGCSDHVRDREIFVMPKLFQIAEQV